MSFPRYSEYKESGCSWLGKVPLHWHLYKLKHVADIVGGGTPSREKLEYWNGDVPWVSPKDMKSETISSAEECITELGLKNSTTSLQETGRVLMVIRSGILQHSLPVAINAVPVALNQDMKSFSFDENKCLPEFFLRWVQGLNDDLLLAWANEGATVESINQALLQNTILPLPDVAEQRAIASFLDAETGKIDRLVAEQRRLIELLQEKRQAVISHAVTKGLNPHVKLKPSGIDWLGDVPEHWGTTILKRLVDLNRPITYGIVQPGEPDPNGRYMIRGGDYSNGWCEPDEVFRVSDAIEIPYTRSRMKAGDLIITIVGAGVGNVGVVPEWLDGANITQTSARIALDPKKADAEFVCLALQGIIGQRNLDLNVYGAAQPRLNIAHIDTYVITVPPPDEQRDIAEFIKEKVDCFGVLKADAVRAIELLQERRTALISAAVTGQIDVREFAPQGAAC